MFRRQWWIEAWDRFVYHDTFCNLIIEHTVSIFRSLKITGFGCGLRILPEAVRSQARRWTDDGTVRLSDGTVTLLLTKSQVRPKNGVQYFGIQVDDLAGVKRRLQDDCVAVSEAGSGQIKFTDPEGNRVVVSESDWTN